MFFTCLNSPIFVFLKTLLESVSICICPYTHKNTQSVGFRWKFIDHLSLLETPFWYVSVTCSYLSSSWSVEECYFCVLFDEKWHRWSMFIVSRAKKVQLGEHVVQHLPEARFLGFWFSISKLWYLSPSWLFGASFKELIVLNYWITIQLFILILTLYQLSEIPIDVFHAFLITNNKN